MIDGYSMLGGLIAGMIVGAYINNKFFGKREVEGNVEDSIALLKDKGYTVNIYVKPAEAHK